eukprot:scaffold27416_cov63-Phaeocystis_antarctica.AAC.2
MNWSSQAVPAAAHTTILGDSFSTPNASSLHGAPRRRSPSASRELTPSRSLCCMRQPRESDARVPSFEARWRTVRPLLEHDDEFEQLGLELGQP